MLILCTCMLLLSQLVINEPKLWLRHHLLETLFHLGCHILQHDLIILWRLEVLLHESALLIRKVLRSRRNRVTVIIVNLANLCPTNPPVDWEVLLVNRLVVVDHTLLKVLKDVAVSAIHIAARAIVLVQQSHIGDIIPRVAIVSCRLVFATCSLQRCGFSITWASALLASVRRWTCFGGSICAFKKSTLLWGDMVAVILPRWATAVACWGYDCRQVSHRCALLTIAHICVIESHASPPLFGQRVHSQHVGLQKVVLVLDLVRDQVLKLLHFNLHDYVVHIGLWLLIYTSFAACIQW